VFQAIGVKRLTDSLQTRVEVGAGLVPDEWKGGKRFAARAAAFSQIFMKHAKITEGTDDRIKRIQYLTAPNLWRVPTIQGIFGEPVPALAVLTPTKLYVQANPGCKPSARALRAALREISRIFFPAEGSESVVTTHLNALSTYLQLAFAESSGNHDGDTGEYRFSEDERIFLKEQGIRDLYPQESQWSIRDPRDTKQKFVEIDMDGSRPTTPPPDLSKLDVEGLRRECRALGLASFGDRQALELRLVGDSLQRSTGIFGRSSDVGSTADVASHTARTPTFYREERRIFKESNDATLPTNASFRGVSSTGSNVEEAKEDGVKVMEVGLGEPLPKMGKTGTMSETERMRIGNWGEHFVYRLLKKTKASSQVVWINEISETGKPYDIEITDALGRKTYIEVKTTARMDLMMFAISWNELLFAAEVGRRYHIYRVFAAPPDGVSTGDSSRIRVLTVENPVQRIHDRRAKLYFGMS